MKLYSIIALMIFITNGYSQDINTPINTDHKKGEFFFAWGYNWSWYSNSDIKFEGENYNFELKSVEATDRQTPFTFEKYFRFNSITIPQYNLRLGYYFKTNYSVSIGIDHMKYVARSGQAVKISGIIENSGTIYDGVYNNKTVLLEEFFLEFEHTDGLNYINAEIRRFDDLFALHKSIKMNLFYGTGIGFIYPKTNSLLLNNDRYDQFNLAGYGLHALFGVGFTFFKHLIIKTELKGGYVNMSNIRTTLNKSDSASQSFFFGQYNFSLGGSFNLCENKQKKKRQ
ncbi:hypothetical protein OAD06_01455 [Flavobacteriaceae bacterium]|jgi:hypothetical protein|nr:hypothetical protein [Flavobacteriaceae bacterium]MDB9912955.1 hypothetical protein [Flavobacteriaceae bacterium]MDB9993539.1 hypothetical protein [Flavobacteriaceae bacterium]|tara:strand:- start:234 stop:1085 length:852 start_codon:yes stop_codon:yes gene_type:complete